MQKKVKIIASIVSVVTVLGAAGGTVYASDSAKPGDFLFPLDTRLEQVQRSFISDPVAEAEFELNTMDERVLELEKLSESGDSEAVADSISEVEAQELRLQERLQEMDQLRTENKIQTEEQQQVMIKLEEKIVVHEQTINKVQTKLESSGGAENSNSLKVVQNKYSEDVDQEILSFEESTGVKIRESEQENNQGEDSEIQNQNQVENQVDNSGNQQNSNNSVQNTEE
jgi:hypothetical protein